MCGDGSDNFGLSKGEKVNNYITMGITAASAFAAGVLWGRRK